MENPKFEVGDHVRISKCKNIFAKVTLHINWKKILWLKRLKILFYRYVISDLNGEEIVGRFYEYELQKTNQKEIRVGKVIKGKVDKLDIKWKAWDGSFDIWIDKKDIV